MKIRPIWILVADGAKASIVSLDSEHNLELVKDGELEHINKPSRELASSKQGRVFNSADGARSAMERPTDPHVLEKRRFSEEIADFLERRHQQFRYLVIAAAPKTLGDLRQVLPRVVREKISGEVDKNLTSVAMADLPKHLKAVV